MKERLLHHTISFKNAFAGLFWAFKTQPNFLVHFTLSLLAIIAGIILQISYLEMTVIIFTIILGLSAEMINTSIEAMTDLIKKEYSEEAKIAKDVSAGMMLLTAIGTVLVALLIFIPHII
jgi:diacylglycerol kinase